MKSGLINASRPLRAIGVVLACWLGLTFLFAAISLSTEPSSRAGRGALIAENVLIATTWTILSFLIAWWHAKARLHTRHAWQFLAAHIPMLLLASVVDVAVVRGIAQMISGSPLRLSFLATAVFYADFDVVRYVAIVAVTEAMLLRRAALARQALAARLDMLLTRARLDHLEAQLQPHFLFNALGAVSELAFRAPAIAARVVRQLASVIRESSTRRADQVTLGAELLAVAPYLDVQRMRFADWLTIDYAIADQALDLLVPRFVLQPLVENAIRHGLSGRKAAGSILLSARIEDETLIVAVADNGVGLRSGPGASGHRIGLGNVRERLLILYGDDDRLRLSDAMEGGTTAELRIPVQRLAPITDGETLDMAAEKAPTADADIAAALVVPRPLFAATRRHPVLAMAGIWLCCGVLWSQQSLLYEALRGRLAGREWRSIVMGDLVNAVIWAALAPAVMYIARRFPLRRDQAGFRALGYVVGGCLVAVTHAFVWERLTNPSIPLWSSAYEMTLVVDLVIVIILVAIAHRRQFVDWIDARESTTAALRGQLSRARDRATRLQSLSPVLLWCLDELSVQLERNPLRSEVVIARLADYLRLAMESSDARGVTPEREASMATALSRLEDTIGVPLQLSTVA